MLLVGEHPPGQVGHPDPHVPIAEVDADHRAGLGDDHLESAAAAQPSIAGAHQAPAAQFGNQVGDRGSGEPGSAGDLSLGQPVIAADDLEDLPHVALPEGVKSAPGAPMGRSRPRIAIEVVLIRH